MSQVPKKKCSLVIADSPRRNGVPASPVAAADFRPPSEGRARLAGEDGDRAVRHGLGLTEQGSLVDTDFNLNVAINLY